MPLSGAAVFGFCYPIRWASRTASQQQLLRLPKGSCMRVSCENPIVCKTSAGIGSTGLSLSCRQKCTMYHKTTQNATGLILSPEEFDPCVTSLIHIQLFQCHSSNGEGMYPKTADIWDIWELQISL